MTPEFKLLGAEENYFFYGKQGENNENSYGRFESSVVNVR
jgi:hypothetical protein